MAYPDIDALTNPLATDPRVGHAQLHTDINEALRYGIRKATVTLSSADILALNTTPVTLVAAPGAGKWLLVHKVHTRLNYGTTAYVATDVNPAIGYGGTSGIVSDVAVIQETQDYGKTYTPNVDAASTVTDNAAVTIGVGDTLTDGDGTLTVTVWYTIEDVPA